MIQINWEEYKQYKQTRDDLQELDNFQLLLEFIKSYYNKNSAFEVFEILADDELALLMLEKREIKEPEQLEDYLYKKLSM